MRTRTLPVEQFYIDLDPKYRPGDPEREQHAREVWLSFVYAHGWSVAEEPTIEANQDARCLPLTTQWFVIGKVVRTDETLRLDQEAILRAGALVVPR